jgi:hypothetical protein
MPVVRFPWSAQLVSIRRETVPRAQWDKAARAWSMTAAEADVFLQAVQARMAFARMRCTVTVDRTVWVLGFVQNAPHRQEAADRPFGWSIYCNVKRFSVGGAAHRPLHWAP